MADPTYEQILTSLIRKQMLLLGPKVALEKVKGIANLKVSTDGMVTGIGPNPNDVFDEVLSVFMDFPSRVAAKEIIEAKSEQSKEVRNQIASGWLQIENEKTHLVAALETLYLGLIITNEELVVQYHNPAISKILGSTASGQSWSLNEMQAHLGDKLYLPIKCNEAMESRAPLAPIDVAFDNKHLRFFIAPIINFGKQIELMGVTILIEDLGTTAPIPPQPAA